MDGFTKSTRCNNCYLQWHHVHAVLAKRLKIVNCIVPSLLLASTFRSLFFLLSIFLHNKVFTHTSSSSL
jgi:hypothetical protein